MNELCIIVFFIFVVLQVLDVISTHLALKRPGIMEKNPVMRRLMEAVGILPAMIAVKAVTILIVSAVYFLTPALRIGAAVGLGIASVFYVVVVVNNFKNARG